MPDNLHSDYEFEKVQIWFVARSIVASEKDNHFYVVVSPEQAIEMLRAHLTMRALDGATGAPEEEALQILNECIEKLQGIATPRR